MMQKHEDNQLIKLILKDQLNGIPIMEVKIPKDISKLHSFILEQFKEESLRAKNPVLQILNEKIDLPLSDLENALQKVMKILETKTAPIELILNFDMDVTTSFDHDFQHQILTTKDQYHNRRTCRTRIDNDIRESAEQHYVGLVNQAMTCYLNSLLQALYMTPEFRNALYKWEYKNSDKSSDGDSNMSIPHQLQTLFLNLQTSPTAVETTSLTKSFGWKPDDSWNQHDIQELCRVMFDALEQKFKNTDQADLINELYEGKINDYVKCLTCNTGKYREDTFLDIPLPVRSFSNDVVYGSVQEALEAFVKYETLEGSNQYFCETCNDMSDAHKGLKFTKFPYILTLQLKRFDFDHTSRHRVKLNDRVEFPDTLNLNSFIESTSNHESLNHEDVGMSMKCDDNYTTDSPVEEDSISYDMKKSNSNHIMNHDQDDDEGIDGMSLNSYNTYNHNSSKIREEYANTKGPYIYELFNVMIHSGSASGGHYYAYIKDFKTNKWLCFDDQTVRPITHEEIKKSYGGGIRMPYPYRSSANAYMLMYRQINKDRNALPMDIADFPPHLKELLDKIKEDKRERRRDVMVYYRDPHSAILRDPTFAVPRNCTLSQITKIVYEKYIKLYNNIDLDQCRIVTYLPKYEIIENVFDNQELTLESIELSSNPTPDLFVDIRKKNEQFKTYLSPPIVTKVYVVTFDKHVRDGPKYVRAYINMPVQEYIQELRKYFKLDSCVKLLSRDQPNKILEEDFTSDQLCSRKPYTTIAAISLENSRCSNINFDESEFYNIFQYLDEILTFYINTSKIEDQRERMNIPRLSEKDHEKTSIEEVIYFKDMNSVNEESIKLSKIENSCEILKREKTYRDFSVLQDNIQESSNSEDSSLSDSDRTLIGEVPEEDTNSCENMLSIHQNSDINTNGDCKVMKYCKISQLEEHYYKVEMCNKMEKDELKERLQPYLNIHKDFFDIIYPARTSHYSREDCVSACAYSRASDLEGKTIEISLKRQFNSDEIEVQAYRLAMKDLEPLTAAFSVILTKNIKVERAKQLIIEAQRKSDRQNTNMAKLNSKLADLATLWRLIEYNDDGLGDILKDCDILPESTTQICFEKLSFDTDDLDKQTIVYVRKWNRTTLELTGLYVIKIDNKDFNNKIKDEIASNAKIPIENLEFSLLPVKLSLCKINDAESYTWRNEICLDDVDFKTYVLCRDSSEIPKICVDDETSSQLLKNRRDTQCRSRVVSSIIPGSKNSSPRREKALKIL